MDFDELEWHDAKILNIEIGKLPDKHTDIISFKIDWPDYQISTVIFEDVFLAKFDLNFGYYYPSISYAEILDDNDPDLNNFYSEWKGHMDGVKLTGYLIVTTSIMKIFAKSFRIVPEDSL